MKTSGHNASKGFLVFSSLGNFLLEHMPSLHLRMMAFVLSLSLVCIPHGGSLGQHTVKPEYKPLALHKDISELPLHAHR